MGILMPYIQKTATGYRYRRKVPLDLEEHLGIKTFTHPLGRTDKDAGKAFSAAHLLFEQTIAKARREMDDKDLSKLTELEIHARAIRLAREMAQGENGLALTPEEADIQLDHILSKLPHDDEGHPIGTPDIHERALLYIRNQGHLNKPQPTLEDAKRLYIKERVKGDINETAKVQRVERIMQYMSEAIPSTTKLTDIGRDQAREVRDYLLKDRELNASTVNRYLNDIRAMISFAITEFELTDLQNPFQRLAAKAEAHVRTEREPIGDTLLTEMNKRMVSHARPDLKNIWNILANTGCRLGEVTGLLVSDVHLNDPIPYIDLIFHPHRRLKTQGSIRKVPLVGDALEAVKDALQRRGDSPFLFPSYGRPRGADGASQALMKHLRHVTDNRKIVIHSLRHRMEDKLSDAGIQEFDRNLVLGHSRGTMSERYGGETSRLAAAHRALKAALETHK